MYTSMKGTMFRREAIEVQRTSLPCRCRKKVVGMDQASGSKVVALFAQLFDHPVGEARKQEDGKGILKMGLQDDLFLRNPPNHTLHSILIRSATR